MVRYTDGQIAIKKRLNLILSINPLIILTYGLVCRTHLLLESIHEQILYHNSNRLCE